MCTILKPGGEQAHPIQTRDICVSITGSLAEPLRNAKTFEDGREMGMPAVSNAMVAGLKDCILYISDNRSGRRFLVDTGAEVSIVPATGLNTPHYHQPQLS